MKELKVDLMGWLSDFLLMQPSAPEPSSVTIFCTLDTMT